MSSYSKGARGLSVQSREAGIFTRTTISLSLSSRQRPTRYAIHARRNLPDKVLRYLRTVIVTAAVYWGFNSKLALLLLTFQHRAGVRPYTSTFVFAESCVLGKQSLPPSLCHLFKVALEKVPLIPKLRGQFAEFLQHHSLKRLSILYSSTSVGFGYGLSAGAISWKSQGASLNPIRGNTFRPSSLPAGSGIFT